jgi:hypothetical protein
VGAPIPVARFAPLLWSTVARCSLAVALAAAGLAFRPPRHPGFLVIGAIYLVVDALAALRDVHKIRRATEFYSRMKIERIDIGVTWNPGWLLPLIFGAAAVLAGVRVASEMAVAIFVPMLALALLRLGFVVRRERTGVDLYVWSEFEDGEPIRQVSAHARALPLAETSP